MLIKVTSQWNHIQIHWGSKVFYFSTQCKNHHYINLKLKQKITSDMFFYKKCNLNSNTMISDDDYVGTIVHVSLV